MARRKNIRTEIDIDYMAFPNKGMGLYGNAPVAVKNALPGQKVLVDLQKKKGRYEGRLIEVLEPSPLEIPPACPSFPACGGCTFQHIPYEEELKIKQDMVRRIFQNEGLPVPAFPIYPAPSTAGYRNKMEFSFGDEEKGGRLQLGMRKRNSFYEVAYGGCCNIVDKDYNRIVDCVLDFFRESGDSFYHKATHEGLLRHLIVRKGCFTGEILINLITAPTDSEAVKQRIELLSEYLTRLALDGQIVGILHTENSSVADIVAVDKLHLLYGRDYFYDKLLGLTFKISPFSFFQTNSAGAEKLYETAREFAGDVTRKVLFDLYCGTGTIAQLLSPQAKMVWGIELVEEAVAAAMENAALNDIDNCRFIAGDVLKTVPALKEKPDTILLDPPREGIHPKAIGSIIDFGAERIVYVSCKPTSLARDLGILLDAGYTVRDLRLHDMFPRSYHVETVVLLTRKQIS